MVVPVASYSFDESSGDILDRSGNGHDFALNNNLIRSVTGHTNTGVTKNNVGMPVVANPSFLTSDYWSFMFWQQGTASSGTWWVRLYNNADDTGSGILNLGGGLRVRIRKSGSNFQSDPVAIPSDGQWHHYACTYDGTVGKLYIDGILVGTTPTAALPIASIDRIDILEFSVTNTWADDLRFFDIDLSQEQIADYMSIPVTDNDLSDPIQTYIYANGDWQSTSRKIWTGTTWA
jgi:hypothetical protein